MKRELKKLNVSRETLRHLTGADLKEAVAGIDTRITYITKVTYITRTTSY